MYSSSILCFVHIKWLTDRATFCYTKYIQCLPIALVMNCFRKDLITYANYWPLNLLADGENKFSTRFIGHSIYWPIFRNLFCTRFIGRPIIRVGTVYASQKSNLCHNMRMKHLI